MLSNVEYPKCPCGKGEWTPGGGRYGGGFNQSGCVCSVCGRCGEHLMHAGGSMFVVPIEGDLSRPENRDGVPVNRITMSDPDLAWLNNTMFTVWRDNEQKLDEARTAFLKPLQALCGFPPHPWRVGEAEDGGTGMTEEAHRQWCLVANALEMLPDYKHPKGFETSPMPPGLPRTLAAWVRQYRHGGMEWVPVDHDKVQDLPIPPDPVRVRHDARFAWLFEEVGKALGTTLPTPALVPNQYSPSSTKNQPWYQFPWNGHTVTVGPRKRVTVVEVTPGSDPLLQAVVNGFGTRDKVTCYTDGDHHGTEGRSGLHAWTNEKLVEYLTDMLRAIPPQGT